MAVEGVAPMLKQYSLRQNFAYNLQLEAACAYTMDTTRLTKGFFLPTVRQKSQLLPRASPNP